MLNVFTLKENRDFKRVYNRGKSYVFPDVVIYVFKNKSNNVRYGVTASKKIGKAVKRNRARRVIKAAFIPYLPQIKGGYDFVFVARVKTISSKSNNVSKSVLKGLKSAGVLK